MRLTLRRFAVATLSAIAAVATLSLVAPGTALAAQAVNPKVGFAGGSMLLWESDAELAKDLDNLAATGAGWVRIDFDWPSIETAKGKFSWGNTDRLVSAIQARGLRVLALPTYTPSWARPAGTSSKHPPTSNADFADFARAAAERYSSKGVVHWEIWNEPNSKWFWAPAPDPARYAGLLRSASLAIKSVNPAAVVITGGTSPAADLADGSMISPLTFITRVYDAGVQAHFNAVAHHPYSFPVMPMEPGTDEWNSFRHLLKIRDLMVARGDSAKKVWSTEFGAPTGTSSAAVTPEMQAAMATEAIETIAGWSWAGPLFWYSHRDRGLDLTDREDNFGLWYNDFTPKPALSAFTAATLATAGGTVTTSPSEPTTTTEPAPTTTTEPAPTTTTKPAPKKTTKPAPKTTTSTDDSGTVAAAGAGTTQPPSYRIVGDQGQVLSFGGAADLGSVPVAVNRPIVGATRTASGNGYWLVGSDGGIFAFGDAGFHGSTGGVQLNREIVGMAATPSGRGYWLVAADGGIFAFGDAPFHGSTGHIALNQPIVGMTATPTGRGYWMVARDGGIFAFGDAAFFGSTGHITLNRPIVGMEVAPDGRGYWMVASDGGMFTFGTAGFHGSAGALHIPSGIAAMQRTADGGGYWLVSGSGDVYGFGNAPYLGSAPARGVSLRVAGLA